MSKSAIRLVGALVSIILVVVVALQNQRPIQIHLYFWVLPHVPLALIVLLAVLAGVVIGVVGVWRDHRRRMQTLTPVDASPAVAPIDATRTEESSAESRPDA